MLQFVTEVSKSRLYIIGNTKKYTQFFRPPNHNVVVLALCADSDAFKVSTKITAATFIKDQAKG